MTGLATHLTRLERHPARFREGGVLNLTGGGRWGGDRFKTRSPVDESLIAKVALGTAADTDAAAKAAFPAWAALSGDSERRSCTASPTGSRRAPKR